MERLSSEVLQRTLQELDFADLKSIRRVDKRFAELAIPLLFATIRFLGPGHKSTPKRTAEFSKLQEAINEVLPVAGAAAKLVFAPAFFQEGIWEDYRTYINEQLEEPVDEADLSYGSEEEGDDVNDMDEAERYEARVQAVINRRRARVEEERESILEAEQHWKLKELEQQTNKDKLESSLTGLFKHMSCLKELEVHPWQFSKRGKLKFQGHQVDGPRANSSVATMLHTLAGCLRNSNRHIEKLHVHAFNPRLTEDTPAMRHAFTGLSHLRLDIDIVDSLLEDSPANRALPALLKCSRSTMRHLEIISGGEHPQLPSRGVHVLSKILNDGETDKPMSFPNLETFHLCSLIVSTTSLLDFIAAQPSISDLEFNYVYLATSGMRWTHLAAQLPKTVQKWEVSGRLGHEPFPGFEPPIAYNWCTEWYYQREPLPESTGWEGRPLEFMRTLFRRVGTWPPEDSTDNREAPLITGPPIQAPSAFTGIGFGPNHQWPLSMPAMNEHGQQAQ